MVATAYVLRWIFVAIAGGIAGGLAVTGCTSPVEVQAPTTSSQCQGILSKAPIRLLGELQRETTPRDAAAIAWGDPPIVLVCGLEGSVRPDAQVITIEGVDWVADQSDAGTIFTTLNREPVIQVRVPVKFRPEAEVVAELTSALFVR